MKGFKLGVSLVVLGSIGVFLALWQYSTFYDLAFYRLTWDWSSFLGMCLGLIIVGVVLGATLMLYAFEKAMEK